MRKKYKIVLADSSPLYREGIKLALKAGPCQFQFIEVNSVDLLIDLCRNESEQDLLLLDAGLMKTAKMSKLKTLLRQIKKPILLTCNKVNSPMQSNLHGLGIQAIEKTVSLDEFCTAIISLLKGTPWLSKLTSLEPSNEMIIEVPCILERMSLLTLREHAVLEQLKDGLMNKQIAYHMGITEHTVKFHVSQILRKLQVSSRTGLVVSMYEKPHALGSGTYC